MNVAKDIANIAWSYIIICDECMLTLTTKPFKDGDRKFKSKVKCKSTLVYVPVNITSDLIRQIQRYGLRIVDNTCYKLDNKLLYGLYLNGYLSVVNDDCNRYLFETLRVGNIECK